jgi:hypothetical protein
MGVGGQLHAPAALPPGMTRYPVYRRLDRPQGRSGYNNNNNNNNNNLNSVLTMLDYVPIDAELSRGVL